MPAPAKQTDPLPSPLTVHQALYREELAAVDTLMLSLAEDRVPLIQKIVEHIIHSGGKRLRPILTILSAKLCGYTGGDRHIHLAGAIEFLHTATLLHDDVVDESKLRRGEDTANAIWGNAASVLVGDFLLSRAFQLMARDGSLEVLRILSDASAIITEGEVKQLLAASDIATTRDTYIDIIASKTSQLFAAATQVGAVIADRTEEEKQALFDYGQNLGIAFQLTDDALDYSARQEALGKTVGDDFREGKVTLPVILAYEAASESERGFWQRTISEPRNQQAEDLAEAQRLIAHHDTIAATLKTAEHYATNADAALQQFDASEVKKALMELAHFSTSRAY